MKRLALALLLIAAAPSPTPVLRAQEWTAPSVDRVGSLTSAPAECLSRTDEKIEAGRALFRSAVLFGGPAARIGLSCESCHTGGRVNPHFLLPELGGVAGAADVTSEWASKTRGDGVHNPVPIPDLVGVGARVAFGSQREPSLEAFVRGVIVEEFQGPPPPPAALAGLVAYVRALDAGACTRLVEPITLPGAASDVRWALDAAMARARAGDAATAALLLYATQDAIGRIVERLPSRTFSAERQALTQLSRELGAARAEPAALPSAEWSARFSGVVQRISRRERRTYFNPAVLARAL